jgi:glycosyltransferase involved in cell wall biosynthesis
MPQRTEQEIMRNWKYMDPPLVSVCCITYNHEPYIRDAIEGFLMQETDFPFEVIIHDDASMDRTAEIVREYAEQYPQIIKPIFQTENQYSKGVGVSATYVWPRAQGEYIALCEGDDYWTSPGKLKKQVDFLENNKNFIACYHNCQTLDRTGKKSSYIYPECKDNIFTFDHYLKDILPGQTGTCVARNFARLRIFDLRVFDIVSPPLPGDRLLIFLLVAHGGIFCFQETMSVYRYVNDEGDSFSARMQRLSQEGKRDFAEKNRAMQRALLSYARNSLSNDKAIEFIEALNFNTLFLGFAKSRKLSDFLALKEAFIQCTHKTKALRFGFRSLTFILARKIMRYVHRLPKNDEKTNYDQQSPEAPNQ